MSASEVYSPIEDEAAFAEVYRAHHAKLLRYCQYRLRDRHEAEDVAQEAFARAWRSMATSSYDRSFYPWLRVVAGNLCTDVLRKRSRSEPVATLDSGAVDGGMDRIADESDIVLVRQALGRLNDRHRSALVMREHEGLTYDQIAARTGVTSGTVESLLWRARQALKREFTVLAGSEGCFGVIPAVVAALAAVRAASRRATHRVAARLAGSGSETTMSHVAAAAIAAIGVVGGVALTITSHPTAGAPPVVVQGPARTVATVTVPAARVPAAAAPTAGAPSAPATTGPASSAHYRLAGPATTTAAGPAGAGRPVAAPLRVQSPISMGTRQAAAAHNAPVAVNVGQLAVGLGPQTVPAYVASTLTKLGGALSSLSTRSGSQP